MDTERTILGFLLFVMTIYLIVSRVKDKKRPENQRLKNHVYFGLVWCDIILLTMYMTMVLETKHIISFPLALVIAELCVLILLYGLYIARIKGLKLERDKDMVKRKIKYEMVPQLIFLNILALAIIVLTVIGMLKVN